MKLLIFIGLKMLEIGGVVFLPYFLGKWTTPLWVRVGVDVGGIPLWFLGFMDIVLLALALGVIGLLCDILGKNWRYAGKIERRIRAWKSEKRG